MTSIKFPSNEPAEEYNKNEEKYKIKADWRRFIFLPFKIYWQVTITLFTFVTFFINIGLYGFFHGIRPLFLIILMYYAIEVFYLFDVILTIMHRSMREYRRNRHYHPKPLFIIIIDIISLLPFNEVIILVNINKKKYEGYRQTFLKVLLRIVHILYNYKLLRKEAGLNQVIFITITAFLQYAFISVIASVIFDAMYSWVGGNEIWRHYLFQQRINIHGGFDNFTLAYTMAGNTYMHNWAGIILGKNTAERLLMCLLMLFGYLWHIIIYSGQLTVAILHNMRKQFRYATRLRHIRSVLSDWGMTGQWKDRTLNYYWQLWEKRHGMLDWPKSFGLLSTSLQKDVTVDIFWEALRHSHLFAGIDMAFKRELTLIMKSDFLLPGDNLYSEGELKNKMVFISTGVIQVLSDEDLISSIVSLSAGTIICEISCFMPTKSIANYRAATYCDIQTISYHSLMATLNKYRNRRKYFTQLVEQRLNNAKYMNSLVKSRRSDLYREPADEYETAIKRLKSNWRQIMKNNVLSKQFEKVTTKTTDFTFCSTYLDLLVLSNKVELNIRSICLQGKCPFVIDPDSSFCKALNYIFLIGFLIQAYRIPYIIAFIKKTSAYEFSILLILDVLNYFDLFLQMITAIKVNNRIVTKPATLAIMNLKRFSFIIDIIATLPFDYIARGFGLGDSNVISTYLKIPHVIRVYRVFVVITKKENNLKTDQILIRCTKYLFLHVLAVYYFACVLFVMSCFHEICSSTGWMVRNYNQFNGTITAYTHLDRSLIYSLSIFLGVSLSTLFPYDSMDMWAYHFVAGFGYFIFSFCLAELTAVRICEHNARYRYTENYQMLKQFMITNRIKEELKVTALEFFDFQWHFNEAVETTGSRGILNDSSRDIQAKVIQERMIDCLNKTGMFSECPRYIITELANKSGLKVIPMGSSITTVGQHTTFFYVIVRGYCAVFSHLPGDRDLPPQIITTGSSFPVLSIIHRVPVYCDVYASTVVEILYITRRDILSTMKRHKDYFGYLFDTIEWHMDEFSGVLFNTEYKLYSNISNYGNDNIPSYVYDTKQLIDKKKQYNGNPFNREEYIAVFKKYEICSFARFLFIPRGINPYGRFYFYYNIFRCAMGVVQTLVVILSANMLYATWYLNAVLKILIFINIIDLYIRAHCHYYNRKGILVKHPLFTAKHYCKTSLGLDVYCTFPITMLGLDVVFPKSKRVAGLTLTHLITKSAAIYRVILTMHHLAQKYEGTISHCLCLTKVILTITTIMGMVVSMLYLMSCFLGDQKELSCEPKNWMVVQNVDAKTIPQFILMCVYIVITYFSTSFQGIAPVKRITISRYLKTLMVMLAVTRFYLFSHISGSGVGMNTKITEYRIRIKRFMTFALAQNVRPHLVKKIYDDCQYNCERSGNMENQNLTKYINTLVIDVFVFMFSRATPYSNIFQGVDPHYIKTMGTNFKLKHFKKDTIIIQANDIQRNLFFISKGFVEITMANIGVQTLGIGGIFGCFNKRGETRQTISAIALVHVDLLVIESSVFHEFANDDPTMKSIAKKASMLNCEFFESKVRHTSLNPEETTSDLITNYSKHQTATIVMTRIQQLYIHINNIINQQSLWFKYMEYIIFVHIAPLFCILYLLNLFILHVTMQHILNKIEKGLIITCDCIFISRIILEYFLQYVDKDSGLTVINPTRICRRYLCSLNFWLDLLGSLPIEIIFRFYAYDNFTVRIVTCNRLLRFMYLLRYYYRQNKKLNISRHLRWTYIIYISIYKIMLLATLWRIVACPNLICPPQFHTSHETPTVVRSTDFIQSLSIILTYTINMFASTGLRIMAPKELKNTALSAIMSICSLLTISLLLCGFVSILVLNNFGMSRYERQIDDLKIYLKDRELSPQIQRRVWSYVTQLWYCYKGEQIPDLVLTTPKFLREELYQQLYSHHIQNDYYFMNTHVDFIRQLLLHFKQTIYFAGYEIVKEGDLDECMYFIHKGQVQKCTSIVKEEQTNLNATSLELSGLSSILPSGLHTNRNYAISVLTAGKSFGAAQGLLNIPHTSTYKAISNVELLSLKQSDWNYLLRWFPASLEELNFKAKESGLMEIAKQSPIEPTGIASSANVFRFNTVH